MHKEVINFWFNELEPQQWFKKDETLDTTIQSRFSLLHEQAKAGELFEWRKTALGSLAEIILLDQFSRNIYRDSPESFSTDPLALALAQFAISQGFDAELSQVERSFLYMPFMHSESQKVHVEAVALFENLGNAYNLEFEHKHKDIIDRFGRYPHRNAILGRESTEAEIEFLQQPNSSF